MSGLVSTKSGFLSGITRNVLVLGAVSKPFLFFAAAWPTVFGARFADRLGKGIRTAPRDALIADSAAPDKAGLNFGFHRAADTAGAVIGLTLAAVVVNLSEGGSLLLDRP